MTDRGQGIRYTVNWLVRSRFDWQIALNSDPVRSSDGRPFSSFGAISLFVSHLPRPTGLHDDNQLLALHNPSSRFLGNPFVDIYFPHRDLRPPFLLRTHLFDSLRACLRLLWGTPSRLLSNGEVCNSNSRGSGRCILLLFSFNANLDA